MPGGATRPAPSGTGAPSLALIVAVALVGAVAAAHRDLLSSGFQAMTGDQHDGLIAVALISHWHDVLTGAAPWHTVAWFHPFAGTLGYNDGYLLFGLAAHLFRLAGADPLLAVELVPPLFSAMGFAGAYLLGRRLLRLAVPWASVAATVSTLSPGLLQAGGTHIQLYAAGPALLWCALLHEMIRGFLAGARWRFLLLGAAAGLFGGALMLTAFYAFWIVALAILLAGLVFAIGMPRTEFRALFGPPRPWLLLAVPVLVLAVALAPAIWLYLPLLAQTGAHDIRATRVFALGPLSLLDPGPANAVWGWLSPWLDRDAAGASLRNRFPARGVPLLSALLLLAAMPLLWRRRADPGLRFALAFLIAALVMMLATVDFGGRAWGWPATFRRIPGATAVREISRVVVVLAPIAVIASVLPLAALWHRRWRVAAVFLAVLLVAEQWTAVPHTGMRRDAELRRVAALLPPPPGCAAFVATVPRMGQAGSFVEEIYSHNVDAMLLAALSGLRTPNGFSTFNPPGWDFGGPNRADYPARLRTYVEAHGIADGLCAVDFARLRWAGPGEAWPLETAPAPRPPPALGVLHALAARRENAAWLGSGFHALEPWGAWSGPRATLLLPLPEGWEGGGTLLLGVQRFAAGPGQPPVVFRIGEERPQEVAFDSGHPREIALPFGAAAAEGGVLRVAIEDSRAVAPRAIGAGTDARVFGVGLTGIGFRRP
jgi:hypothetical protein